MNEAHTVQAVCSADRLDLLLFATIPADENIHSTGTDEAEADRCICAN